MESANKRWKWRTGHILFWWRWPAGGLAVGDYYATANSASYYIGGSKVTKSGCSGGTNKAVAYDGRTIGGGLLIVFSKNINIGANGTFQSYGKSVNGSTWSYKSSGVYHTGAAGGGSGGGSINIFYTNSTNGVNISKFKVIAGSYSPQGTYNVGTIKTGTYESILTTQ